MQALRNNRFAAECLVALAKHSDEPGQPERAAVGAWLVADFLQLIRDALIEK